MRQPAGLTSQAEPTGSSRYVKLGVQGIIWPRAWLAFGRRLGTTAFIRTYISTILIVDSTEAHAGYGLNY